VLKCRPPQNRTPLPDEIANCRGYLERQLEIIRPEIICALGAVASQAVLSTDRSIGKLRGKFHEYCGIPVICTYHPAYLLRNPAAKVDAWEDLKTMMRRLGVEL
jgi:DNA polymerase